MTEDEFDNQFTPVPDEDGETVRPSDDDLDPQSLYLWTIVGADDGSLMVVSGWHYVNRIGYLVTKEPWTEPTEAVWFPADDDDDDDDKTDDEEHSDVAI
jgi:hypothetical protein